MERKRMSVSKLSFNKTTARFTYMLDLDLCFNEALPKLVLPWFSSDDDPDLKWAIELSTDATCLYKKHIALMFERGSKREVLARVYVKVTSDVAAEDLLNYCITTGENRDPEDFRLLYNVVFQTLLKKEYLGTFYICPKLMKNLTVSAVIKVTDGSLNEIELPSQFHTESSSKVEHQKALIGCFGKLLDSGEFSDITIRVEGRTIPAHQNVLAARSDVFKAMLTNNFKEQSAKVVEIKDAAFNVVELLLRFMYTGAVDMDDNLLVDLLLCADKYMVQDLSALCQHRLAENLQKGDSVTRLCEMLQVADLLDSKTLRDVAIGYLKARKDFIFQSREWKQFSKSHRSVAAAACLDASS